ncbi:MAG: potassium uptake protein, partial [Pseudomonadota bacterium]
PDAAGVLGVLSLVFWALTIIVTIKYLVFIMRADNRGEGGILALMALVGKGRPKDGRSHWFLVLLGLFGAALLYGDGVITPAISVLSAVEGLEVVTPAFQPFVVPVTLAILVVLFLIQSKGTAKVGAVFGPVMLFWFACLGVLGAVELAEKPEVLAALNPMYAVAFFRAHGTHGYLVLGGVFLAVTGGEALYADMGHFGRQPIRFTWFAVALPAIVLNYFGQGASLLAHPENARNPFFLAAPGWAVLPLVVLSTMATVIASQALISASFSLTRQAVQLGYCPRVHIVHTSSREIGQIYVPSVNWALMVGCLALVVGFRSSTNLAAAYGIAVTCTMAITTVLFFFVLRELWNWPPWSASLLCGLFLAVDLAFLGANAVKFFDGGWVPLLTAVVIYALMTTWKSGRTELSAKLRGMALPLDVFLEDFGRKTWTRVPGTAVFMAGNLEGVPPSLLHNLKHNKVIHQRVVLLTVATEEVPVVPEKDRLQVEELVPGFWRMVAHYGFMEDPHIPNLLQLAQKRHGLSFKMMDTTFFLGRETLVTVQNGIRSLRARLFQSMSVNARSATSFFHLPPNRVIELGAQIEL